GQFRHGLTGLAPSAGDVFAPAPFKPNGCLFSPDRSWLAAQAGHETVRVWDLETGREVAALPDNESPVWSGDGQRLATTGGVSVRVTGGWVSHGLSTIVNVWEVTRLTPTHVLPSAVHRLAFRPDGQELAINGMFWEVVPERDRLALRPKTSSTPGG